MPKLNREKFLDCVSKYKREALNSLWRRQQLHKFYFSNYVSSRVNLLLYHETRIFQICTDVEEKNFYFSDAGTKICGVQFLRRTGSETFTESLTPREALLFRKLAKTEDIKAIDFADKKVSYNALSGWLGTLLPRQFMPVTSTKFRHVIAYLFDEDQTIYEPNPYEYFVNSQNRFLEAKKNLKQVDLTPLFLAEINDYMRALHPKFCPRRHYSEADWNWVTQDFFLFVYRELLHLDAVRTFSLGVDSSFAADPMDSNELLNIYMPGAEAVEFDEPAVASLTS